MAAADTVPTRLSVINSDNSEPSWVTDDTIFPLFLVVLHEWIPEQNPAYKILIARGTVTSKGSTYFVSDEQISRYLASRPNHTIDSPSPVETATGTPIHGAHTAMGYKLSQDTVESIDAALAATILGCVGDATYRRELNTKCTRDGLCSGREVLRTLQLKKEKVTNTCNSVMTGYRQDILEEGPKSTSLLAFTEWQQALDGWNLAVSAASKWPEELMGEHYLSAIRDMGDKYEMNVDNAIKKIDHPTLEDVLDCCKGVLSEADLRATRAARKAGKEGRSLMGTDVDKPPGPKLPPGGAKEKSGKQKKKEEKDKQRREARDKRHAERGPGAT